MEEIKTAEGEQEQGPLTVQIDAGLRQRFKVHCALNNITIKDAVADALEAYMQPIIIRKSK